MIRVGASLLAYVADVEANVHKRIFVQGSYYGKRMMGAGNYFIHIFEFLGMGSMPIFSI